MTPTILPRDTACQAVPTFIVVDGSGRVLDRTKGEMSAVALARFYNTAAAKAEATTGIERPCRLALEVEVQSRRW